MKMGLLQNWLEEIELRAKGQYVIVPGGGTFADFIRTSQTEWNFDDFTAHQMSLLAMEQYAYYCHSLFPSIELARSVDEITQIIQQGLTPVCMASCLFHDSKHLEPSWDVTSDTIAIQLAIELKADALLMIKKLPESVSSFPKLEDLAANELVDKAFIQYINQLSSPYYFLDATDPTQLQTFFSSP